MIKTLSTFVLPRDRMTELVSVLYLGTKKLQFDRCAKEKNNGAPVTAGEPRGSHQSWLARGLDVHLTLALHFILRHSSIAFRGKSYDLKESLLGSSTAG